MAIWNAVEKLSTWQNGKNENISHFPFNITPRVIGSGKHLRKIQAWNIQEEDENPNESLLKNNSVLS